MRSYAQYCPVAKATEILGDRWTLQSCARCSAARAGSTSSNAASRGSRSVLTDRMRRSSGPRSSSAGQAPKAALEYRLRLPAVTSSRSCRRSGSGGRPGRSPSRAPTNSIQTLLIVWMARHVDRRRLPPNRTVVKFRCAPKRRYWMVLEPSESRCLQHPEFDVDLEVSSAYHAIPRLLGTGRVGDHDRRGKRPGRRRWWPRSGGSPRRPRASAPRSALDPTDIDDLRTVR